MNYNEFKENLIRLGIKKNETASQLILLCPFSVHENLQYGRAPNFIIGKHTGTGSCAICEKRADFQEVIAALETKPQKVGAREQQNAKTSGIRLWSAAEILDHDFGTQEWLVEKLIPKPGIVALSGNPGDFKTWLTMCLAKSIARGEPAFGRFPTERGAVLIVDEEDHLRHIQRRFESLEISPDDTIHYASQNGVLVDNKAVADDLLRRAKEIDAKLIILDSLVRVHRQDENSATQMNLVFQALQVFIKEGISVLFTHHHRKQMGWAPQNPGQNLRGSSDILAAVDCHFSVERKNGGERLIVKQGKNRHGEPLPTFELTILKNEQGPTGFEYAGEHDERAKKAEEAASAIVAILQQGVVTSRQDLQESLIKDYGKGAIDEGIKIAQEKEWIEEVPKAQLPDDPKSKRRKYYRIPAELRPDVEEVAGGEEHTNNVPLSQTLI